MEFQIDTRKRSEVRVGVGGSEVAVFRKVGLLIHNLQGSVDGADVEMKLPAPWTGFRYRLRRGEEELASARRTTRLQAFDAERPYVRHRLVELDLDALGESWLLTPLDRHGLRFALRQGEQQRGLLEMRPFGDQKEWSADLAVPDAWSLPLAAFVAWLADEGRRRMDG